MRDMLKDLYASISESKNKKIQDKQAVVLKYMRFAMKLDDLDDVMKILQKKDASPDLISSAFRTARYLIDEAPPAKRKALSSKLLQYQKNMPEENVKMLYKLLARTGDPKVLDMMEKSYKEDPKRRLPSLPPGGTGIRMTPFRTCSRPGKTNPCMNACVPRPMIPFSAYSPWTVTGMTTPRSSCLTPLLRMPKPANAASFWFPHSRGSATARM